MNSRHPHRRLHRRRPDPDAPLLRHPGAELEPRPLLRRLHVDDEGLHVDDEGLHAEPIGGNDAPR